MVQAEIDNSSVPFIRFSGPSAIIDDAILLQDAGRSGALVKFTLLAYNPTSKKFVPFEDEAATDGTAIPVGIYLGDDITEAAIIAGDIADILVLIGNAFVDKNQLIIENSKTIDTIITVGTTDLRSVEQHLRDINIYLADTIDTSSFET